MELTYLSIALSSWALSVLSALVLLGVRSCLHAGIWGSDWQTSGYALLNIDTTPVLELLDVPQSNSRSVADVAGECHAVGDFEGFRYEGRSRQSHQQNWMFMVVQQLIPPINTSLQAFNANAQEIPISDLISVTVSNATIKAGATDEQLDVNLDLSYLSAS